MKKTILLFMAMFALLMQAQQTKRIYLIGNSVTDAVNFDGFKALAESAGNEHIWARHVILGSPLNLLWENFDGGPNKDQGYVTAPFGYPKEAFAAYAWDAVTLQPFDRSIEGDEGDKRMIKNYINELVKKSPEAKVCIYSRWPRKNNIENQSDIPPAQDYNDLWDGTYNKNGKAGLENERRKYFHDLTDAVVADNYGVNIVMIPVGEVFYELNKRMMQGDFPGCDNIWKVYSDGIHLNTLGNYIVSTTFFTTIYEQDPVGLSVPGNFSGVTATQAKVVQEVAKQVVLAEKKYTKIEYFGEAPVKSVKLTMAALELNVGKKAVLIPVIAPANAANKNVTWESNSGNVSVDENGVVTAKTEGTAEITVKTEDGAFTDKCLITVVNTGTPVNALSISSKEESIYKGETKQLSVTVEPDGATNKNIVWLSSDENIATVSQTGLVTAVKKGTASVTALSENGALADTCEVKVIVHNNPPDVDLRVNATAGYAPFKVYFDGSKSTDPDPDDFVLGYNWKIEELGIEEKSNGFEYTFTQPGTYTVTLSTVDSNGATSLATGSVTITVLEIPAVDPDEPALCYDGFDYVSGPLHSLNGGRGWKDGWNVQNGNMEIPGFEVRDATAMKYKNLKSVGNYMIGGRAYLQAARSLNTSSTGEFKDYVKDGKIGKEGTTLWLSTLIRKEKNNNDGIQLSLFNGHPGGSAAGKVHFGYFETSGDRKWEMKVDETVYSSGKPLVIGEAALIIAKIEFGETNKISLYINPAQLDGSEPAEADVTATTSSDIAFSTVGLSPTSGPEGGCFDEIRFGKTYADVTPYKILQKYMLTVQDGTVQGGNSEIEEETLVTVVANTYDGKRFFSWTSEDDIKFSDPAVPTTTFTMPAKNVTVKANYIDVYNVSVENGTADKQQASEGETVTVMAAEIEGKRFINWTSGDDIKFADPAAPTTTFTMPAKNVVVTANYIDLYNVSVENGTADKQQAAEGETVTVTAAEREGELFYRWNTEDDILLDQPYSKTTTFVMPAKDIQVSATYEKLYTIEVEGGHADVSETTFGKVVNIPADVPEGYIFNGWESSGVLFADENNPKTSFSMPARNVKIKATFIICVAIGDTENTSVILYPNPAYDYIRLSGTGGNDPVRIYSADGHLMISIEKYNGELVDIASLSPGAYYVKVTNKTFPFIKK